MTPLNPETPMTRTTTARRTIDEPITGNANAVALTPADGAKPFVVVEQPDNATAAEEVAFVAPAETWDVCIGASTSDSSARVLVTVVGQHSADGIVSALRQATLFQCEGQKPFARAVNRA